jgi:transcription antitermination factor NusA-like protein
MEDILLIKALENISKVNVKDCIARGDVITYLVKGQEVGRAIGKKAVNVKELESKLKKKIEIIGFYKEPADVLIKTFEVKIEEKEIKNKQLIVKLDMLNKKKVFSRSSRFKRVKELIKRNYDLEMILN